MTNSWSGRFLQILFGGLLLGFTVFEGNQPYPFPELNPLPELPESKNPPSISGVKLGRFLFYDPILSQDSSVSCSSCHKQRFAFSDGGNQFSFGVKRRSTQRNTLPLFNLGYYTKLFWDGRANSIENQVFHPVRSHEEMNLKWEIAEKRVNRSSFYRPMFEKAFGTQIADSILIARAIGQFERTLISNNSKYDKVLRGEAYFTKDEYEGFVIVNDQSMGDCLQCHSTDASPLATNLGFANNGLDPANKISEYKDKGLGEVSGDSNDIGRFKVPSLRNIALTAPYMHDGRFETLEEVIDFYSEGVNNSLNLDSKMMISRRHELKLSQEEKGYVIAFLKTLTDSSFISDSRFANPFLP